MKYVALSIALALPICGCGPTVSGVQIIKANIALSAAETAGAPKSSDPGAIYSYTAAKEYLQKAREEAGYSDFAAARKYADEALKYAEEAREKAAGALDAEQTVAP